MTLPTLSPNPKPNYQDRLRIMQTVGVALAREHAADERHWAHLRHLQP